MSNQQKKLNELLLENAIGVSEFAACMGLTEKTAEAYCDGTKKLTPSLARQIEQTFSKPANWLMIDSDSGPNYDLFG